MRTYLDNERLHLLGGVQDHRSGIRAGIVFCCVEPEGEDEPLLGLMFERVPPDRGVQSHPFPTVHQGAARRKCGIPPKTLMPELEAKGVARMRRLGQVHMDL